MVQLPIGIAGAGNIATASHLPAYAKCSNATVAAIADIDGDRAKAAAERFHIPRVYSSAEEMIQSGEIEAVDICTWNSAHAPIAVAAARAGKAVLCEKPMAVDLPSALEMERAVREAGVTFMLAVPSRFRRVNRYVRAMVENGELGDIYFARTANIRRRGTPSGWFTDCKTSGGGPVIDIGIHRLDAAWYLMGNPRPVRVSANTFFRIGDYRTKGVARWEGTVCPDNRFDCEDAGAGVFHFDNGALLLFETSWAINAPAREETLICGTKAGVSLDPLTVYGERDGYLSTETVTMLPEEDRFLEEITHFADCVIRGKETRYPLDQAVTMQRMLQGIYDSAATGAEVTL